MTTSMTQKFLEWAYKMSPKLCYYSEIIFYILLGSLSVGYFVYTYPHN